MADGVRESDGRAPGFSTKSVIKGAGAVVVFLASLLTVIAGMSQLGVNGGTITDPVQSIVWKRHEVALVGKHRNGARFSTAPQGQCFGPEGRGHGAPSLSLGPDAETKTTESIVQCVNGDDKTNSLGRTYTDTYSFRVRVPTDTKIVGFRGTLGIDQQAGNLSHGLVSWDIRYGRRGTKLRQLCFTQARNGRVRHCPDKTMDGVGKGGLLAVTQRAKPAGSGGLFAGIINPRLAVQKRRIDPKLAGVLLAASALLLVLLARKAVRALRQS